MNEHPKMILRLETFQNPSVYIVRYYEPAEVARARVVIGSGQRHSCPAAGLNTQFHGLNVVYFPTENLQAGDCDGVACCAATLQADCDRNIGVRFNERPEAFALSESLKYMASCCFNQVRV